MTQRRMNIGLSQVRSGRVGSGRVGSGRVGSGRVGSGRVGSGRCILTNQLAIGRRGMVRSDCARRARRSLRSLRSIRSQRKRSRIRAAIVALRSRHRQGCAQDLPTRDQDRDRDETLDRSRDRDLELGITSMAIGRLMNIH
jgi:hypothetical protein